MQWVSTKLRRRLARQFIRTVRAPVKTSHNLYVWSRDSVANSVFIGLFCAMLPLPTQMIIAGSAALAVRAHVPLAVALVWLSNPITFIPLTWASLQVGCSMLGVDSNVIAAAGEISIAAILKMYWQPLVLGSLTIGLSVSLAGYLLTRVAWVAFNMAKWGRSTRTVEKHAA